MAARAACGAGRAARPGPPIRNSTRSSKLLKPLIAAGANPVVFCRFIATADHVAAGLRKAFPKLRIEAVTGALTADERRARVEAWAEAEQRLLVATDCLSEGINLQALFDSVVHYDLSWNPTRHQQREGRVDRFGQPARLVRSVLLYSPDSAIDGAVLDVILRKAEAIRKRPGDRAAARGARRGHRRADERGAAAQGPSAAAQPSISASRRRRRDGNALARCRGRRAAVARPLRAERDQAGGGRARMATLARLAGRPRPKCSASSSAR